jgi:DNA-binding CsgD family transcriptional regulator
MFDQLLQDLRDHTRGRVVVLRGEPGIGKTALLEYLADRADGLQVLRAMGVQSEMELTFAGLQQLCCSLLDRVDHLPSPQREAVRVAFGISGGPAPDRFLVALGVLGMLSRASADRPVLCMIDDAQWLDQASAQVVGFVARRLDTDPVALVFATRHTTEQDEFAGLSEHTVERLEPNDAWQLLESVFPGRLDKEVVDRSVAETHGNPRALLELARAHSVHELAGGFAVPPPLAATMEETSLARLQLMPAETQRVLLVAAAEPVGDPTLLWRAAGQLGLDVHTVAPAECAGLVKVNGRVQFRHPLLRSAVYDASTEADRQAAHRALAEATDAQLNPDRRAWHRAKATLGPDEDVATELAHSADRALARGGAAARAAFLERSAALTGDHQKRAQRTLAAAEEHQYAGAPQVAMTLLTTLESSPLNELQRAFCDRLRGQIGVHTRGGAEAWHRLLNAAARLESLDPPLARETYIVALNAATLIDEHGGAEKVARAIRAARNESHRIGARAHWILLAMRVAADMFDDETWHLLATRLMHSARDTGALSVLPVVLSELALLRIFMGEFNAAAALAQQADGITEATANAPITNSLKVLLAAYQDELGAPLLIEAGRRSGAAGVGGAPPTYLDYADAVLHNGLGRYEAAMRFSQRAAAHDGLGPSTWALADLVEAATRAGHAPVAFSGLQSLSERVRCSGSSWALGIEARSRALLADGRVADELYSEAIQRLGDCRLTVELARARLLYGEWLRRQRRRIEARAQLRTAYDLFSAMGAEVFARRACRELLATGEHMQRRTADTSAALTTQEQQITDMARAGRSNREIGSQLFISTKTVEYHLHKAFAKLGISSRHELAHILGAN